MVAGACIRVDALFVLTLPYSHAALGRVLIDWVVVIFMLDPGLDKFAVLRVAMVAGALGFALFPFALGALIIGGLAVAAHVGMTIFCPGAFVEIGEGKGMIALRAGFEYNTHTGLP